jgi:hypothetical protein
MNGGMVRLGRIRGMRLTIQMRARPEGDEKLRAIRILAFIRHTE